MSEKEEKSLRDAMLKVDRAVIEHAYQRAMNIRDRSPQTPPDCIEARYGNAYRKAYKLGDRFGFRKETVRYLKALMVARGRA